jgi:molybdopterin converting factor small subunit
MKRKTPRPLKKLILPKTGPSLAKVTINFIGPWRLFLGVGTVTVEVDTIDEARNYVETTYGPVYEKTLKSRGIHAKQSVWENSNVLLNRRAIRPLDAPVLKDGDNLDLLPPIAGG